MNDLAPLSTEDIDNLFSIVMYLDQDMHIAYASRTLQKCMPQTKGNPALGDVFDMIRPSSLNTFREGVASVGSLCLLTAKNNEFAIRGQLIHSDRGGSEILCFYGAPWLFWLNSNAPDTHLSMNDFSAQDVQLDQLFFMSTEKKMVTDLEILNTDLIATKIDLEAAQESQKQFFAQMSHEIRTPLNGVISALSLLDQNPLDEDQSQYMRLAKSSSENLLEVINYVLSVSKLELSPSVEHVSFSWADLVRSTVDVVKARADEKCLSMNMEIADDLPPACYGSKDRFRQTILNLLINAIKFTNTGSVTVRASNVSSSGDHKLLRLEVIDTGVGIAKNQIKNIFQPYWSNTPDGIADQTEGTGLGLDISRRNVHSMGGKLQVNSTVGEGTRFWFELLVELAPEADQDANAVDTNASDSLLPLSGKVLLVDDNETNLILGSKILETMGLEVIGVDGGAKAIEKVQSSFFDLVLMDLTMPKIDGLEATRQIRGLGAAFEKLPIVALTAHVDEGERKACLKAGMNDYLTKPILRDALHQALTRWIISPGENTDSERLQHAIIQAPTDETADPEPLINQRHMDDLISQIGRESLTEVINKICAESQTRWQELAVAIAEEDIEDQQRHVHSLQSIFRSVGLTALGERLAAVEVQLKKQEALEHGWLEMLVGLRDDSLATLKQQLD